MKTWTFGHTIAWLLFIVVLPLAFIYKIEQPVTAWWILMAGFMSILLITGHGVTGSMKGAFVDNRNTLSLSRFQMMAWTILILSALCAAAFWNIKVGDPNPLNIGLKEELWLLMGISTASLVGSPLILNGKKALAPDRAEMSKTFELLKQQGYDTDKLDNQGHLIVNAAPHHARWSDLFTGEETGNFAHLDLARLQMFFFTLVALLVYGAALLSKLGTTSGAITELPTLTYGLLALIGISHTGYLTAKATANSQSGSQLPQSETPSK